MKKIEIDLDSITETMSALKDQRARLSFELKQTEKDIEKLELQLAALLGQLDVKEMQHGIYSFGFITKKRTSLDQQYLKEHYADIAAKCTFTKENEVFDFKING